MSDILGHVIEGSCVIAGAAVGAFGNSFFSKRNHKDNSEEERVHLIKTEENLLNDMCAADKVCIYAVNSFMWLRTFEMELSKNKSAHIKELVILLRKRDDENQSYLDNLDEIVKYWKKLRDNNHQIGKLSILYYKNNPDHYYVIIGDSHVLTGHVYEDIDNVSGTKVDLQPICISNAVFEGKEIISRYQKHFDDLRRINKKNKII